MLFHFDGGAFRLPGAEGVEDFAVLRVVLADDPFIEGQLAHARPFIERADGVDLADEPDEEIVPG